MVATEGTTRERLHLAEVYERFFDDLYHMGRPAEIFETAPDLRRKPSRSRPRRTSYRPAQRTRSGRRTAAR